MSALASFLSAYSLALAVLIGVLVGWIGVREWQWARRRQQFHQQEQDYHQRQAHMLQDMHHLRDKAARDQHFYEEKIAFLTTTREGVEKNLRDLCNQALLNSQQSLLTALNPILSRLQEQTTGQMKEQAATLHHLTAPLEKSLRELAGHIGHLEQSRAAAYEGLKEQILGLTEGQRRLNEETNNLITALRTPHIRGCWGEMQLRRVVELAGMLSYCDFQEQSVLNRDAQKVRPDMIVHLAGGKSIIVDAKAPIIHYLESSSAKTTEDHKKKLRDHSRLLLSHIKQLADKEYWNYHHNSVEFVVLFLPGEAFLSAALETDPTLIEAAAERNIVLATPTILIALLKTIAQGWRQEKLSQHTQRIVQLGKELYHHLEDFQAHMEALGKSLNQAMTLHRQGMTTLDRSILPAAHQLGDTGIALIQQPAAS